MQTSYLDAGQIAETLKDSHILAQIESPSLNGFPVTYVLEFERQDILLVVNKDGSGMVVYPCGGYGHEEGSIHDQARMSLREARAAAC
ncbi:hypothetical protein WG899_06010 [Paucibacter sp. AS339]|uniref:hypothetical protein n=1 Tax=Paucibacter hankyongi TaxID=3133434 RepID=UPI0030B23952